MIIKKNPKIKNKYLKIVLDNCCTNNKNFNLFDNKKICNLISSQIL